MPLGAESFSAPRGIFSCQIRNFVDRDMSILGGHSLLYEMEPAELILQGAPGNAELPRRLFPVSLVSF